MAVLVLSILAAGSLSGDYNLSNIVGMSNFVGRPSFFQRVGLGAGYTLNEFESLSLGAGANAELFTDSNGSTTRFVLEDVSLGISTSRVPSYERGGVEVSFPLSLEVDLPTSNASRKVSAHYTSWSTSVGASAAYKGFSLSLGSGASYTFYKTTHRRYDDKAESDRTQEGSLQAPLTVPVSVGLGYKYEDFSASANYSVSKSLTYANNVGQAYWRDGANFGLSGGYALHALANLKLAYSYGFDPLDGFGRARLPFWLGYADWHNQSRLTLSVAGSYS
jgi:hypothetical protein